MRKHLFLGVCCFMALCGGMLASPATACSVPVFRYALEIWPADRYQVVLFHDGPAGSNAEADAVAARLLDLEDEANIEVFPVDVNQLDGDLAELWSRQTDAQTPWMVVRYPYRARVQGTVWAGPANASNVEAIVDSPVRQQIAERILKGETAVWVLLESGSQEEDDAAEKLLQAQLERMEEALKLPELETPAEDGLLRIAFSIVRLSRDDPAEEALRTMLLDSEEDLRTLNGPMAFPVFGRGRALYALIGAGINEDTIEEACGFLTGACSCEVKEQNPGVDLLLAVAWDELIEGSVVREQELPPLTGLDGFVASAEQNGVDLDAQVEAAAAESPESASDTSPAPVASFPPPAPVEASGPAEAQSGEEPKPPSRLGLNLVVALLAGLAIVAGGAVFLTRKSA